MWIFTKHGFYSAVCARVGKGQKHSPVDPDRMMVRGRMIEHLRNLQRRFPEHLGKCEIVTDTGTDYAFRLFVDKLVWAEVMKELVLEVDYDNFKGKVARHQGPEDGGYEDSLHKVWSVMHRLQ